jgi:hypothetical protein
MRCTPRAEVPVWRAPIRLRSSANVRPLRSATMASRGPAATRLESRSGPPSARALSGWLRRAWTSGRATTRSNIGLFPADGPGSRTVRGRAARSFCVVEDDPDGVAHAGAHSADSVPEIDAVVAFEPLTGRLWTAKATASPCLSGTTSARLCMRGHCSVNTSSPPVKRYLVPRAGPPLAREMRDRHRDPDAGS